MSTETITIQAEIAAPIEKVWHAYSSPAAITQWNFASPDWCCPRAEVDLRPGGKVTSRMEAKDGSMGFDFSGTYEAIETEVHVTVRLDDGRHYRTDFVQNDGHTLVKTTFDAETENPVEMQRAGWQAILNNFKTYVEGANS